jgi:hypothetical protein
MTIGEIATMMNEEIGFLIAKSNIKAIDNHQNARLGTLDAMGRYTITLVSNIS